LLASANETEDEAPPPVTPIAGMPPSSAPLRSPPHSSSQHSGTGGSGGDDAAGATPSGGVGVSTVLHGGFIGFGATGASAEAHNPHLRSTPPLTQDDDAGGGFGLGGSGADGDHPLVMPQPQPHTKRPPPRHEPPRQDRWRGDTAPSRTVAPLPLPGGGMTRANSMERDEDEVAALVRGGRQHASLPLHGPYAAPDRPLFTPDAVAEWRARHGMDGTTAGPVPGGGRALPARARSADAHDVSMRLSDRNQRSFLMPLTGSVVALGDVALATVVEGEVRAAITSLPVPTVS